MASYGLTYDQFQELFDAVEAESEGTYWESGFRIATGRWGTTEGLVEYIGYRWGESPYSMALCFGIVSDEDEDEED